MASTNPENKKEKICSTIDKGAPLGDFVVREKFQKNDYYATYWVYEQNLALSSELALWS